MKLTTLEKVHRALVSLEPRVTVPEETKTGGTLPGKDAGGYVGEGFLQQGR